MNLPFTDNIIYIASDLTAGVFLITLIFSITYQAEKRFEPVHLMSSAALMLGGILVRLFAETVESLPENFVWKTGMKVLMPVSSKLIYVLAFLLIVIGIAEAAVYIIDINDYGVKNGLRIRYAAIGIIIASGTILYVCTGSTNAFTLCFLAELLFFFLHLYKCCSESGASRFVLASLPAVITFAIVLAFRPVRLTGIGFALMLVILNELNHDHIVNALNESEEELAKGKVQLLAEQISPHYIYNSLQSIRYLCEKDPARARDAIDSFSEFLRGNLESLTAEELIPFARELELTQAYLELEKLTGRGDFEVEYRLETTDFMLPPLVLQPVVENAVQHGALASVPGSDQGGKCATEIIIATRDHVGYICIEVTDMTKGRENTSAADAVQKHGKKKSVGLENVRTRLAIQSGGTLTIESIENGKKITIILPKQQKLTSGQKV